MESCSVSRSAFVTRSFVIVMGTALAASLGHAQLVTPRTIPVKQTQQFEIFPTSLPGWGSVTLAIDDTLGDGFANPAKLARVRRGLAFVLPYKHGVTDQQGAGQTLPGGALVAHGPWTVGLLGAMQETKRFGQWNRPISEQTAENIYLSAGAGRRLGRGISVGASVLHSSLGAVDGVDVLYAGSSRIDQAGGSTDFRVGATRDVADGGVAELVVAHSRTDVSHRVVYPTVVRNQWGQVISQTDREELNENRTHIWGALARFTRPLGDSGWRVGFMAAGSRLDHPKIPNYTLVSNIPRDPGTTWGANLGVGVSRTLGRLRFGADVIWEPMTSHTWADAATDTAKVNGGVIRAGEKTIENDFLFRNSRIRLAVGRGAIATDTGSSFGWNYGLGFNTIRYRLIQDNYVQERSRIQNERWRETSQSFGVEWRRRDVTLMYGLSFTCGTDGCGFGGDRVEVTEISGTGGIITAPTAPLRFRSGTEWAHRFTIVVPFR